MIKIRVKGYSLLELVIVVAIITAIAVFALPAAEIAQIRLREKELRQRLTEFRQAIDRYVAASNGSYGSFFPPSIASLTEALPDALRKPGADSGPYLMTDSLGNPFTPNQNRFLWDIRDSNGVWHTNQTDPKAQLSCCDVRFPAAGVSGWVKGIDETFYEQW